MSDSPSGTLKRSASSSSGQQNHKKGKTRDKETAMAPAAAPREDSGAAGGDSETPLPSGPKSVLVVGAGPAGLMLACNLVRYGIDTEIFDDRPDKTSTGRADGLQPKTIETLRQLRLADDLLKKGVKIYDICFWNATPDVPMCRTSRVVHYPEQVATLDPYVLLVHQGMIEDVFLEDLKSRGVRVTRNMKVVTVEETPKGVKTGTDGGVVLQTKYVVGCDGAHSLVRKNIPGIRMVGESGKAAWGVLDGKSHLSSSKSACLLSTGVIETDFPDIWSKAAIHTESAGSVLCIPRERNMTRLYIELDSNKIELLLDKEVDEAFVMRRAKEIMKPFSLVWKSIEWFSVYRVGQRVASSFSSPSLSTFIVGDASHTHSPKAAQGMNVSMHDAFNLAWKMNLVVRNIALPSLLTTFELERKQIAQELIEFDYEHANAFLAGDSEALAKNFDDNIRFISGVGAEYKENVLNISPTGMGTDALRSGALLPPAQVVRYIDANPVHLQLDIPMLSQFRIYFFVTSIHATLPFLIALCSHIGSSASVLGRASEAAELSYREKKVQLSDADEFLQPVRYTAASKLFTPAIVTSDDKSDVEIADLPPLLRKSPWTFYIDEIERGACIKKYFEELKRSEIGMLNVRPDGYIGSVGIWDADRHEQAAQWLDAYYAAFLRG